MGEVKKINKIVLDKNISPTIFIGSSMSQKEVKAIMKIEADIKPPIRRGDLKQINPHTQLVAIVDGIFYSNLAISPREILDLLERGITVIGSSSMGALRAVELDRYGMEGIGRIYNMYKNNIIQSDAEVALTFSPKDYKPITEPLVNIRYAIKEAEEHQIVSVSEVNTIVECAKRIYFSDLSYNNLFKTLKGLIREETIEKLNRFINENKQRLDLKRNDAIELINYIDDMYERYGKC
ncbi:MAG: TfuA-related McrA-glycine thioamidation protein [Firmicutes bacterium HGW-Firmicutes-1]|jgi:hypothetical protein|nr:MAG: TfuA-related McrA-glycine thioamidation protein [Firmicutes bacterium HGW-Firmicutes-1]